MIFLADENFPFPSIRLLRNSSYRVISIIEEIPGARDSDILKKANIENLILLTFDRDYGELIYKYKLPVPHGLIYFRFTPDTPEEPASILLKLLLENYLPLVSMFTTVERDRIRQRLL